MSKDLKNKGRSTNDGQFGCLTELQVRDIDARQLCSEAGDLFKVL